MNVVETSCGRQNHESRNSAADAKFHRSAVRSTPPGALKRDSPEAPPNTPGVETTAGNSPEPQFREPRTKGASCSMAPPRWQCPTAADGVCATRQFWAAQSGAHVGATTRATSVSRLNTCSGHLAIRIRITLRILFIYYATPAISLRQRHRAAPRTEMTMIQSP